MDKNGQWEEKLKAAWLSRQWQEVIRLCEVGKFQKIQEPLLLFYEGNAHRFLNHNEMAMNLLQQYAKQKPAHGEAHMALGTLYLFAHNPRMAERHYQRAIELGCWQKEVWNNYGTMLFMEKRMAEAEEIFLQGLRLYPQDAQCHFGLAQVWIYKGRWTEAWPLWRSRFLHSLYRQELALCSPAIQKRPFWEGEIFSGKRLLLCQERGFGDTIWYARYFSQVKERGGWVILAVKEPLLRLSERFKGVDEIVRLEETVLQDLGFDVQLPCMELPRIFGTTPQSIPLPQGYLPKAKKIAGVSSYADKLRIGLVWHTDDPAPPQSLRSRNISLSFFQPLLDVNAVEWVSLQVGPAAQELQQEPYKGKILDLTKQIQDFEDTAKQMEGLDLIITADTATAHLAGSLGIPTWVMLPWLACGRWLEEEEKTVWYHSLSLFRCAKPGGWQEVIQRVKQRLEGVIANKMKTE